MAVAAISTVSADLKEQLIYELEKENRKLQRTGKRIPFFQICDKIHFLVKTLSASLIK